MDSIGERIYELRKKNNMSQGDLANELDTSRQTISKWENNVSTPELDKIVRICEIFSVSSDYILRGLVEDKNTESHENDKTIIKEQTVIIEKGTDIKTIFASGLLINAIFFLFVFPKMFYIPIFFSAVSATLLFCKKNAVYYSLWLIFICINIFCSLSTAGGMDMIFDPSVYTAEYKYLLIVSYLLWISLFSLIGWGIKLIKSKHKITKRSDSCEKN